MVGDEPNQVMERYLKSSARRARAAPFLRQRSIFLNGASSPPPRESFAQVGFGLEDPLLLKEGQAVRQEKVAKHPNSRRRSGWFKSRDSRWLNEPPRPLR